MTDSNHPRKPLRKALEELMQDVLDVLESLVTPPPQPVPIPVRNDPRRR